MPDWIGSVLFVLAITFSIALHEWGHLITAKWFGMRAERYFVGFGPTLWSTRRGETEYGVKWLFLGGFVRIAGMSTTDTRQPPVADAVLDRDRIAALREADAGGDEAALAHVPAVPDAAWEELRAELDRRGVPDVDREWIVREARARAGSDPTADEAARAFQAAAVERLPSTDRVGDVRHRVLRGDEGRFFHDRPAWQRAIVLAAGSGMHFLLAIVLLFAAFWSFGTEPVPEVEATIADTPAAAAGLAAGDRIVSVAGQPVDSFDDAKAVIEDHPGEPVTLTVERDDQQRELTLTTALVLDGLRLPDVLADAGFEPGDRVVAIDDRPVEGLADLRAAGAEQGTVPVTVVRFGETSEDVQRHTLDAPAAAVYVLADEVTGLAGFIPVERGIGPIAAAERTFVGPGSFPAMFTGTISALGQVFGPEGLGAIPDQLAGGERDATGGASLVGLTMVAGEGTALAGAFFLLGLVASLNVFVGIFNLVPLPPLDGGHLAVLGVERAVNVVRSLRGRDPDFRVDPRTVTAVAVPVIVFVGLIALALIVLDITNPLQLPQ